MNDEAEFRIETARRMSEHMRKELQFHDHIAWHRGSGTWWRYIALFPLGVISGSAWSPDAPLWLVGTGGVMVLVCASMSAWHSVETWRHLKKHNCTSPDEVWAMRELEWEQRR